MLILEQEVRDYLETLKNGEMHSKRDIQLILWRRKLENLLERRKELKKTERIALSLIEKVDYSNIQPRMVFCSPKDRQVWVFLRNVLSSAPWQDRPGRAIYLFCQDAVSGGILGIMDLGSDLATLGPRDKYIGWTQAQRMSQGKLKHLINLGTCVSAQPFGWLTGGKYMSVATTGQKIVEMYQSRYGDVLTGVTTTSLYGKSSQYERLKEFEYLGETNGSIGTGHISNNGKALLNEFLSKNQFRDARGRFGNGRNGPGGALGGVLNDFINVCKMLGENPQDYSAKQPRGVYFAELGENTRPFLRGETSDFVPALRPDDEITEWWLGRWYKMRYPKKRADINAFDFRQYRVDAQIEHIRETIQRADVGEIESRLSTTE